MKTAETNPKAPLLWRQRSLEGPGGGGDKVTWTDGRALRRYNQRGSVTDWKQSEEGKEEKDVSQIPPGEPVFGGVPSLEMGNQGRTRFGLPDGSEHIASVVFFFSSLVPHLNAQNLLDLLTLGVSWKQFEVICNSSVLDSKFPISQVENSKGKKI